MPNKYIESIKILWSIAMILLVCVILATAAINIIVHNDPIYKLNIRYQYFPEPSGGRI
jgi:hypothetical protein